MNKYHIICDITAGYSLLRTPIELPAESVVHGSRSLRRLDQKFIRELAKSIQTIGLMQPIMVRPAGGSYEVVFGDHRLEACKNLGWSSIPAVVKEMSSHECFLTKVVENLQRNSETDPLAEAEGYVDLIENGWTINAIATRIGKSDSYVSDRVGLVRRLHPEVARKYRSDSKGSLKASHLELLARVRSMAYQLELSEIIQRRKLSVRKLERLISKGLPFKEKVQRNGDSLYIRIPTAISVRMGIDKGSEVCLYMKTRKKLVLETLDATQSEEIGGDAASAYMSA